MMVSTPLYGASQKGHCEVVSMLLAKEGVDVNQAMDRWCKSKGHFVDAAGKGGPLNQVVDRCCWPRRACRCEPGPCDDGITPLCIAASQKFGHCEVVSMLLAKEGRCEPGHG